MIIPNTEVLFTIIGLEFMAGLFSNVFIIIYLTLTSLKERKVTTCNCILISLSISNLCFTILFSANSLIRFGFPRLFIIPNVFFVIYYLTFCSFSCISWLTFILCFFYFIKIQHFQPGFFAWIKKKIDVMVPWMMLAVLSVSLLSSYLLILISNMGLSNNSTHTAGLSSEQQKQKKNLLEPILIINSLAQLLSLFSTSRSAWFLKQQQSAGKFGNSKVKDYRSAVHNMICLLSFYVFIYVVFVFHGLQFFAFRSWGYWMCLMLVHSSSAVYSLLIISGNPKLREAWVHLFTFRCILNQ